MSTKKPSKLEMQRAVRYMRHVENCRECNTQGFGTRECDVALGHYGRWVKSYYREALGTCKHLSEGECWEERCKGGRKT